MIETNFIEEIGCGSFFDHIEDLLEVPGSEDVEACGLGFGDGNSFPDIWTGETVSLPGSDSVLSVNSNSDLSAELSVPYEDIVHMEWLSNFVEDSFSGGRNLTMNKNEVSSSAAATTAANPFKTSSPVSVLESSNSCQEAAGLTHGERKKRGRPRSKRPRPATFQPRPPIPVLSSPTSSENSEEQEKIIIRSCGTDSRIVIKLRRQVLTENKKIKKMKIPGKVTEDEGKENVQGSVRKCTHCEITKTPQWRAGPMGPKTLCNACGVRYKSGRLFPEYRPAASPTFVPSVHSNSHKKVLEMRIRSGKKGFGENLKGDSTELIPNQNNNLATDYI